MNTKLQKLAEEKEHKEIALWAAQCAEHVLPIFECEKKQDTRVRRAIKMAKMWAEGEAGVAQVRKAAFACHAAARDVIDYKAACMAARAAGHAAATAHVKTHAVYAAEYARKAIIAAGEDVQAEETWQYETLKKVT